MDEKFYITKYNSFDNQLKDTKQSTWSFKRGLRNVWERGE